MLNRKFTSVLENHLLHEPNEILLVNGARQIGKSYSIRYVGQRLFQHFIEINLKEDSEGHRRFAAVRTTEDLYFLLTTLFGRSMGTYEDTLVFLDEIQSYPSLLTMLKFLNQEKRYRFIASGSQLGIALQQTPSVPIGSVTIKQMYPLDFEEFLWAMGMDEQSLLTIHQQIEARQALSEGVHNYMLTMFRYYLVVGGLPQAVQRFVDERNMQTVLDIHSDIHRLYQIDASQYDDKNKLVIRKVYDLIPSALESKKKRIVFRDIEQKKSSRYTHYADEFDYLIASGIALQVQAISNPIFPLLESASKNLLKLYLNDVGLLTTQLYGQNIDAVMQDIRSVNLGTVYESVVAQELCAHGFNLYYYDNKKNGEVDFMINDYHHLSVLPIEVKSGKDYRHHSALDALLHRPETPVRQGIVLSNERLITMEDNILYLPVYAVMFLYKDTKSMPSVPLPELPKV